MVPVVGVDHKFANAVATSETYMLSPPNSVPLSASIPAVLTEFGSASDPKPGTPAMHISPNADSPMSFLPGAQNVYMPQATITMANKVQNIFTAEGNERTQLRILTALRENLLPRAEFAKYDAASPVPRNACTQNTRKAILDTLRAWASDNTTTKVYWLNGMAGTGKTTLAYSLSEILDEMDSLVGCFFCSHLRVDTSDVRCIIPTISLQLAVSGYLPSLSQLILDVVEANPDCGSWRIGKQFLNFIVRPLTAAYRDTSKGVVVPVIVLDALDECSDHSLVAELLSVILKHSKSLPVKFFITSRPEVVFKETFDGSLGHSNFILHEVEKEVIKADIELYVKACLLGGQTKHNQHNWPPQDELESIVEMSGTLFIYAATVCKYIAQKGSSSMPQRLSDVVNFTSETTFGITQPLDVLYKRILDIAYDSTNPRERSDIGIVLKAVVYVYNPLSMTAISVLVQIPIERVEAALASLCSLIYIPSFQQPTKHISIFHASFYDFISNQILSSKHYLDLSASHTSLALQCLSLMDEEWVRKRNFVVAGLCISPMQTTTMDLLNQIIFSRDIFCDGWIVELGNLIDAEWFLKEHFNFIKINSLEGCPSALAFLPENSDIWKTYGSRMDCPCKLSLGRRKSWNLSEAVLRHSEKVNFAVFSPDGMHIVSASADCTAWIWNTATGECEAELKGHSGWVNSAVFSPDSMHIVSASYDKTAQIWNTATGECEAELKGHSHRVISAVFSSDGMHIVSASDDCTAW
ncbi:hypothetical protein BYT27DRAFT_7335127 [Phlegmacium glaucopus]|nr:hypothetical protein BYT27DRAFT_7335127 [Phlegmacium glaucopus]